MSTSPVRTRPFPSWPVAGDDEVARVTEVIRSGKWGSAQGTVVTEFEAAFAEFHGAQACICACNGTLGLEAALRAVGVGTGDEVIVPPYTFIGSVSAILYIGAVPIFVDVDPGTHLLDAAKADAAITARTKAIMAVHIAGRPCDMDALVQIGRERGVAIVEDAAQAHGAAWRGQPVGAIGDVGMFSFQSSKNMSAGEGAALVTNRSDLADRLYSLVNVGRVRGGGWYQHDHVGTNLRMTEFQGAILHSQLDRFPAQQEIRTRNAGLLSELLGKIDGVRLPDADERITAHGWHLYVFRVPVAGFPGGKAAFLEALAAEGIPGSGGYPGLHRNDAVAKAAGENAALVGSTYATPDCPVTDELATDTVWFGQNVLLADPESDPSAMYDIAAAVEKVLASAL